MKRFSVEVQPQDLAILRLFKAHCAILNKTVRERLFEIIKKDVENESIIAINQEHAERKR